MSLNTAFIENIYTLWWGHGFSIWWTINADSVIKTKCEVRYTYILYVNGRVCLLYHKVRRASMFISMSTCTSMCMWIGNQLTLPAQGALLTVSTVLCPGAMLGLNMASNSLIRTVSPTVGGIMLHTLGFSSFGYLGFLSSGLVTLLLFVKFRS